VTGVVVSIRSDPTISPPPSYHLQRSRFVRRDDRSQTFCHVDNLIRINFRIDRQVENLGGQLLGDAKGTHRMAKGCADEAPRRHRILDEGRYSAVGELPAHVLAILSTNAVPVVHVQGSRSLDGPDDRNALEKLGI